MTEIWLPAIGWEGLYEISDLGRVRSCERQCRIGSGRIRIKKSSIISVANDEWGRPAVKFCKNGKTFNKKTHKLVAEAFIGPCPVGMEVRHLDGNAENSIPTNLAYGTKLENEADKVRHGTRPIGSRSGTAVLTESDVLKIRSMRGIATQRELAAMFGVCQPTIHRVQSGEAWAHVSDGVNRAG